MEIDKYHIPILLKESIEGLSINAEGIYVDVTFGGGGHSRGILDRLGAEGKLFAFDQDADAIANVINDERFVLIPHNFEFMTQFLRFYGVQKVDGILADLGVSSHQFDVASRGFSIRFQGALDMRMNQQGELTAAKVINEYRESDLADVLFRYGELRNARKITSLLVKNRKQKSIKDTQKLVELLSPIFPERKRNTLLAQVFQALRIEVNQELRVLEAFLNQVPSLLKEGGTLAVISYHSLEDRLVKNFIKTGNFLGMVKKDFYGNLIRPLKPVGKLIRPSEVAIKENNRARSAKLRISVKNNL